jgi:hypothetical protein
MFDVPRLFVACAAVAACAAHADATLNPNRGDERERPADRTSVVPRRPPPSTLSPALSREVKPSEVPLRGGVPVYSTGAGERVVLTVAHRGPLIRFSTPF